MCLQNAAQFTILEEKTPMEGSTMAYTDDWESLMNGVFGAGGENHKKKICLFKKRLKHSGLKRKRLRKTKVMA